MQMDIINQNAEQALLTRLDQNDGIWGALYINCAKLGFKADEGRVTTSLRTVLEDKNVKLYFFSDGDIVVTWYGAQKNILDGLRHSLSECLHSVLDAKLDTYYDSKADNEKLRSLCQNKLTHPKNTITDDKTKNNLLTYTREQQAEFQSAVYGRKFRTFPEILVVEDQVFSLSLLRNLLDRDHKAYSAMAAKVAWKIYLEHAPDIVLLDIELPEINGHELAEAIVALDPQAYIVMVTANSFAEDVARSKTYGAKNFIIKPYNKQKILDSIKSFYTERNPKRKSS